MFENFMTGLVSRNMPKNIKKNNVTNGIHLKIRLNILKSQDNILKNQDNFLKIQAVGCLAIV